MIECERCHRHVRASEARCPFCDGPRVASLVLQVVGAALTTIVLAACYGTVGKDSYTTPPFPTGTTGETGGTGDTGAATTPSTP